jgi:hypothetical protein
MTLTEREIDLASEYDRLDAKVKEYASEYAAADAGSDYQRLAASRGKQAEQQRDGVAWALGYPDSDEAGAGWDTDTITLAALTQGEEKLVLNTVDDTDASEQDAYVAAVSVDAPYLAHDPESLEDAEFKQTVRNVLDLKPSFVAWVEARADEITSAGDSGNSFMSYAQEAATSTTSPDESG